MDKLRSSRLLSAAFTLLAAALVVAQAPDQKQTVAGATNFICLDASFASGGVTSAEAFTTLKQLGYKSVVNLQTATEGVDLEAESKTVNQAGLKYFGLPFAPASPDPTAVDKFLEVVKDAANQPVYIHCRSGHRANAFWMIKRVMVDGWTLEKASAEADTLKVAPALRTFVIGYLKEHGK